ncbi:F-box protein SKP2B-like [Impatiens glandulifera]|uniref:F-box protein SKP2B-like n=1 Tax=Impatiens glandulifera TaxID=253017 RepID=UPI001FB086AD|nr:F-box protein SKP2B-like [Impatiens glandulifera]
MVGREGLSTEDLKLCFEKMMISVVAGNGIGCPIGIRQIHLTGWSDLPMELLLRIVSLLDDRTVIVASGVCCGWRDGISRGLTHLSLSWCKNNMNGLVMSLVPKFTQLQRLILRQNKPQLEDNAVKTIANCCYDLQELDLSKSFKLTDQSLYSLADGCPNLLRLNISGCSSFGDKALIYLAQFCRKLKYLNLCGCVNAASDNVLQAIGYYCNELQSVNLGWCEKVGDAGVSCLAHGCPNLQALDLCGCILITDISVIDLANNCPSLKSLGLYYCHNITDKAMYSLAHSQMNRKTRKWVKDEEQEEEGLVNLNISQCTALTPKAVQAVCDSNPALHTCPGRHSLKISGCLNLMSVYCTCVVQSHRYG